MTTQESLREAARLRLRVQMNNRLRLESIAAISKVFRDFGEPIKDELLASVVFAVPAELMGEYDPRNATVGRSAQLAADRSTGKPSPSPPASKRKGPTGKPSLPPKGPTGKPSLPPKGPTGKPSLPPKGPTGKPSLPPKGPTGKPSLPPKGPTGKPSLPPKGKPGKTRKY